MSFLSPMYHKHNIVNIILKIYNFIKCKISRYVDNEGIKALETTLKRKDLPTKVIMNFLKLILTLNNFILNCTNFYISKDVQ